MKLSGKTAIVTGGYRGLGLMIAKALLKEGARVAICGRSIENLKRLDSTLEEYQGNYLWSVCDITTPLQVNNFIKKVLHEFGSVDILVNNAAIFGAKEKLQKYDPEAFREVIAVNIIGTFNIIRHALKHMTAQNYGKVIIVSGSHTIEEGKVLGSAYYISKLALDGLSSILSSEISDTGICVNTINPAGLKQDTQSPFYDEELNEELLDPEKAEELFIYLASTDSNGVTGKNFNAVDWLKSQNG
ncbi:SDR family oxidoreductase [bacterium]|nr:SDR family oxidoreductase [bacterium]